MRRILPLVFLAASAAQAQSIQPGLWEVTMQMNGVGMPAMPAMSAADRKQMEAMGIKIPGMTGGPMSISVKTCVTKEEAEEQMPPQTDEDRRNKCQQEKVKVSGNTVHWKIECKGEQKMSGSGSMTTIGKKAYKGESTVTTVDKRHGPMTMTQNFSGKWLAAACK